MSQPEGSQASDASGQTHTSLGSAPADPVALDAGQQGEIFEDVEVNADAPVEEVIDAASVKTLALKALARLSFRARPLHNVLPAHRERFYEVLQPAFRPKPGDTSLEKEAGKHLEIVTKTAAEARGYHQPSKHRLGDGTVWRNVEFCVPPAAARLPLSVLLCVPVLGFVLAKLPVLLSPLVLGVVLAKVPILPVVPAT